MRDCIKKAENVFDRFRAKKCSYMISYTVLFAVSALLVYGYFALYRKTMVWDGDGIKQHYNALLYISRYLKNVMHTFLSEHRLVFPMWDFSVGYGSDILTTFHYYGAGDPMVLLSVLVPESLIEHYYTLLFLMRLYIGGLGFSYFSILHGNRKSTTLIGALIYCFSAFPMVLGIMHSCFLLPVAWFPWILYGAERIFRKKNPIPFILAVGIAAISNYYFFYMQAVLLVIYCVFRYITIYKKINIRELIPVIGRFTGAGIVGVMLSLPIMLPLILATLNSGRFNSKHAVPLLYDLSYYVKFFSNFMNTQRPGYWTLMGYTAIGMLAVMTLFFHKEKKWQSYRAIFIIGTAMLMIPACAFALTGFSYVTNRWTWGYSMIVGMIAAKVLPDLDKISETEKKRILITSICLSVLLLSFSITRNAESITCFLILICAAALMMANIGLWKDNTARTMILMILLMVSIAANGKYRYSVVENDSLGNYFDFNAADKNLLEENADEVLNEVNDSSFYRIDESSLPITINSSILRKKYTNRLYFSLTDASSSDFLNKLYFNVTEEWHYDGVENRSLLELLTGVKYYISNDDSEKLVPPIYNEKAAEGDTPVGHVTVWKNPDALPVGFTCDSYIPYDKFSEMSETEREAALLTGAVMEHSSLPEASVKDDAVSVLEDVVTKGNAEVTENSFVIRHGGSLTLKLKSAKDAELHVLFKNLKFKGMRQKDTYDAGAWSQLTAYEKQKVYAEDAFYTSDKESTILFNDGERQSIVGILTANSDVYSGRHDFLANIGYSDSTPEEITVTFRNPGTYTFEKFDVVASPLSNVLDAQDKFGQEVLTDIEESVNSLSGKITVTKPKALVLSIPYMKGWKAYVDGTETEIIPANVFFMALELKPGSHKIELHYETPYVRAGLIGGVVAVIVVILIGIFNIGIIKNLRKKQ